MGKKECARKMAKTIVEGYSNLNNMLRDNVNKTNLKKNQSEIKEEKFYEDTEKLWVEVLSENEPVNIWRNLKFLIKVKFILNNIFSKPLKTKWAIYYKQKNTNPIERLIWLYMEDVGKKAINAYNIAKINKDTMTTAMEIFAKMKAENK